MRGTLLGIPVESLEPTQRNLRDAIGMPKKVRRQKARVKRRAKHWSSASGSLSHVWVNSGTQSSWGPFQSTDCESDAIAKRDVRWMRVVFAVAGLGRDGVHAIGRLLDFMDEPLPPLGGMTPFAATECDECFADLVALLSLSGGFHAPPGSIYERRFEEFKSTRELVAQAKAGDPGAERVYNAVAAHEPRETLIREIISCREIDDVCQETLLDWYRAGRLDDIERVLPNLLSRRPPRKPW